MYYPIESNSILFNPAYELKQSIGNNTLKGLIASVLLLAIIATGLFSIPKPDIVINSIAQKASERIEVYISKHEIPRNIPPKTVNSGKQNFHIGTDQIAASINIVDNIDGAKIIEFADISNLGAALSKQGDGLLPINDIIHIENNTVNKPLDITSNYDSYDFVPVEIEPQYNSLELQKNITYPQIAKKIGLEGQVIVKALIDATGKILFLEIIKSDNEIFNQVALDAIYKTEFKPAFQNGKAVKCPIVIPISFKLR